MNNEKILSNEELLDVIGGNNFIEGKSEDDVSTNLSWIVNRPMLLYAIPPQLEAARKKHNK